MMTPAQRCAVSSSALRLAQAARMTLGRSRWALDFYHPSMTWAQCGEQTPQHIPLQGCLGPPFLEGNADSQRDLGALVSPPAGTLCLKGQGIQLQACVSEEQLCHNTLDGASAV